MKKIITLFLSVSIICGFNASAVSEKNIYVSTLGSKTGNGTYESPFDTLETAIAEAKKANEEESVNIYIRGGNYYMDNPAVVDESVKCTLNISAYNGEKVVLTGGKQIKNWKEYKNGIYSAYVPGFDYIRNMTVNGVGATRAYTETKLRKLDKIGNNPYFKQGLVVSASDLPADFTGKNSEIQYQYKWQDFRLKIDYAAENPDNGDEMILYFKMPLSSYADYTWNHYNGNNNFAVINDLSLLDNPGEFYYDKDSSKLYYMPEVGVDMNSAAVYVGNESELLKIEGSLTKKVTDVAISGITFANTAWDKTEYEGFASEQSVMFYDLSNDTSANKVHNKIITAAVQVTWAENIKFTDNKFENIGQVGVGLYEGVNNSLIEGNVFTDIGASAITVGLPSHGTSAKEGVTDVAYNKYAWAGSTYLQFGALCATDGESQNFWCSNSGNVNDCWLAVDLKDKYTIDSVELWGRGDASYNNPDARKNFEIQASNSKDFSNYVTIASQGNEDFGLNNCFSAKVSDTNKYRYVRMKKTSAAIAEIKHFKVYTKDLNGAPEKERCKKNEIANNYVVRAGKDILCAAGIHIFAVSDMNLHNNVLRELPYTGISFGYFGTKEPLYNNRIEKNRILDYMQRMYDGGAIYTLGIQPGMIVAGNYCKNARFGAGGYYPDEDTTGTSSRQIEVVNNVFEDVPLWAQMWKSTQKHIYIHHNLTNSPVYVNNGTSITMQNNYAYVKGTSVPAVTSIYEASGLTGSYVQNYDNVVTREQPERETLSMYTEAASMNWVDNFSGYKSTILANPIHIGKWYLKIISENAIDTSAYPEYAVFERSVNDAQIIYDTVNERTQIYDCRTNLINATRALEKSGIFDGISVGTDGLTEVNSVLN